MAPTEPQQQSSSIGGIWRLLNLKKPESQQHQLIHPTATASSVGRIITPKKKTGFALRGLGCASASSASQALAPDSSAAAAAVRLSADWQGKRRPRRRRDRKAKGRAQLTSSPVEVADVSDVWCAPGVVFGAGAEASVDCVVAHHRRERIHRERHCTARHGGDEEIMSSFLDCPSSMEMRHFESGALHSGHLRCMRGRYRRSPAEFEEMMMFQNLGRVDVHDQYNDLRLDVDNMSYEELLELSEKIGYVNTGLREEEILRNLRKPKHSLFDTSPSQKEWKCIICQEEYEVCDDMGKLECGHSYHTHCIKQWLLRKNACPICKTAMCKR